MKKETATLLILMRRNIKANIFKFQLNLASMDHVILIRYTKNIGEGKLFRKYSTPLGMCVTKKSSIIMLSENKCDGEHEKRLKKAFRKIAS